MDFEVKNQQLKFKEKEMKVAKNNLDLAIKSYKKGLISITDRLQSETDYQKAAFSYYKFVAAQRLVAIDLLIATGSLNIENLNN